MKSTPRTARSPSRGRQTRWYWRGNWSPTLDQPRAEVVIDIAVLSSPRRGANQAQLFQRLHIAFAAAPLAVWCGQTGFGEWRNFFNGFRASVTLLRSDKHTKVLHNTQIPRPLPTKGELENRRSHTNRYRSFRQAAVPSGGGITRWATLLSLSRCSA